MLLFWFVSPFCPCRITLGETYPTVSASKCRPTQFVSPYLLCKPNLDDTYLIPGHGVSPISPGASVKGELLPYFAARTCFSFGLFHLFPPAGLLWAKHTLLYQQVNAGRHSLFRLAGVISCFLDSLQVLLESRCFSCFLEFALRG